MLRTPGIAPGPAFSIPTSCSRKDQHIQLSYELHNRVNFAKFYPLRASNGSRIVVYGHNHGLTCLWRGGTPFEPAVKSKSPSKSSAGVNASGQDDLVMIDSDGDLSHLESTQNNWQDAQQDIETDSAQPFDPIIHSIDINLGSSAIHVSFAALPLSLGSSPNLTVPQIFQRDIVLAVACADGSVHILTVPLLPSAANGSDVTDLVIVEASHSVRNLPRGIALTWTSALELPLRESYPTFYLSNGRGSSDADPHDNDTSPRPPPAWSFLVAYHTAKKSGLLRILELPLDIPGLAFTPEKVSNLREINLPNPAKSISFSQARFPSEQHTELLVVDSFGIVRIYEPLLRPPVQAALTPDLTAEQLGDAWLATLYAPFEHARSSSQASFKTGRRSEILDAQWTFDGQAVIVLLTDGQWGIWDLVGVGPGQNQNPLTRNPAVNGKRISGGGVTRFALRGYIGQTGAGVPTRASSASEPMVQTGVAKLAPMTPNTRKAKQDALFKSTAPRPAPLQSHSIGGISLLRLPADPTHDSVDESLFMWFNSEVYYAPSLMTYWQQAARSSNNSNKLKEEDNAGTLFGPNLASFQSLSTEGEMITNISQAQPKDMPASRASLSIHGDILMSAEHRLLLFCPVKQQAPVVPLSALFTAPSKETSDEPQLRRRLDQEMLTRGDLDLGAMDKMLDTMNRGTTDMNGSRRVEFALGR